MRYPRNNPAGTAAPHSAEAAAFDPNLFVQNTASFPYYQNYSHAYLQTPPNLYFQQNPNFNPHFVQPQNPSFPAAPVQSSQEWSSGASGRRRRNESLERIDYAVVKARRDLVAAGESVSSWKVAEDALLMLQADSWSSLGFQLQEVPSLNQLMAVEAKINSFIHCFIGVRKITSLYDLEGAICRNEGIKQFDELELGPLFRHPLAVHYFSLKPDTNGIHKISSENIFIFLSAYLDAHRNKKIEVTQFLDFIAERQSISSREKLGIRIQSLGMHISFIHGAMRSENSSVKKSCKALRKKQIILSTQKKVFDERFDAITQRVTSFSSTHKEFHGKHIRYASTSSETDESDDMKSEKESASRFLQQHAETCDRVSSCPYPSAMEEITRLGMKDEMGIPLSSSGYMSASTAKKKRKLGSKSHSASKPSKSARRNNADSSASECKKYSQSRINLDAADLEDHSSMRAFITTWKEACHDQTVAEVFDRMLLFYDATPTQKKRMRRMFSNIPCAVILQVAVASIKSGMWDSCYDICQSVGVHEPKNKQWDSFSVFESIDVEPNKNKALTMTRCETEQPRGVTVEDIIEKLLMYVVKKNEVPANGSSPLGIIIRFFRITSHCENWLKEQFSVTEFKTLGHGEFLHFFEKNASLVPIEMLKQFVGDETRKSCLEIHMLHSQLVLLLSQALNSSWENGAITGQAISELLTRQFPLISFSITDQGSVESFIEEVKEQRNNVMSVCVLFSVTLLDASGAEDSVADHVALSDCMDVRTDFCRWSGVLGHMTLEDANKILLQAPMLCDLYTWSHWEVVFAPSLGPLIEWLMKGISTKELLCLVTTDGRVIRLNHLATPTSFLEAVLQKSPFHTAVELTSLFSVVGGKNYVPMSLLKNHARQAFEVILKNSIDNLDLSHFHYSAELDKSSSGACKFDDGINRTVGCKIPQGFSERNKAVTIASRFALDCLTFVPSEFRDFVANVLLSGLSYFVKNAPSQILCNCRSIDERIMLHGIGLSLGITEWIEDYRQILSADSRELVVCVSLKQSSIAGSGKTACDAQEDDPSSRESTAKSSVRAIECSDSTLDVSGHSMDKNPSINLAELDSVGDAAMIIESIRQEEFGLGSNRSKEEDSMLAKQHARLGRALHCLSQELYSQDSHFLLELVQNADDNVYPENTEPTLIFILMETGIVVLNNEQGFSAQNIRALCDVGSSTKKGSGAGYIGQKGIGFKSVFRITDAPEIHSNNFHVKFDISEGQIGFVLPTIVPPCDIDRFNKLACADTVILDANIWKTCIVLPFSSKISRAATSILPMFSDLHPSLLLFLHRLSCIRFKNTLDGTLTVMKKEIIGDGIVKVSHGMDDMIWLLVSQKMQANALRANVQSTEISLAFTLQETEFGYYRPCLNQQPVFAFLPLRTYGLKFILQGDFVLPSSREGVDADCPWNQWLLSEFPNLFVNAERSFCELPCFKNIPGKAVTTFMSFVPLVGEVHGFFANLPRMIISKLRVSNCLLQEGEISTWVPPCKVLRNWNDRVVTILPTSLLYNHLGKVFLDKDIVLSDPLAKALGVEDYGPTVLLKIISSLCDSKNELRTIGYDWLCSFLGELYDIMLHSSGKYSIADNEFIIKLRNIPFIPLSDGTFSSVEEGAIWMHSDLSTICLDRGGAEGFKNIYGKLRTVSPVFLSAADGNASCTEMMLAEKIGIVLQKVGVQKLSAHDIMQVHILPAVSDEKFANENTSLFTEYLSFVMVHLQSSCTECTTGKFSVISELLRKALILTNFGYKRPAEVSIHFGKEYGSPIDISKLINAREAEWYEVDMTYVEHAITKSVPHGQLRWREFFLQLGITDFVSVKQVNKNLSDLSQALIKDGIIDSNVNSPELFAVDWECRELVQLLSMLSTNGNRDSCKYMLKLLDNMWDAHYNDKVYGWWCTDSSAGDRKPFKSAFMRSICDIPWVVSSMDDILHLPKDLFHDCTAVRTVLGPSAPYAIPKVNSEALLEQIGFKTQVTIDDILDVLQMWRRSVAPFKASISQMSKLYTSIWNVMDPSKQKVIQELLLGAFIFVPEACPRNHEEPVCGKFMSPNEVYWHDSTGCMNQIILHSHDKVNEGSIPKIIGNIYPGLHDFFVVECGVIEGPPLHDYVTMLLHLATSPLTSQAADAVFRVFMSWSDGLHSGIISSKEIDYLKECLLRSDYKILPTERNKWVSLHPSFGSVCWSDDDKLKKEFKHLDNIDFICFGEVTDNQIFLKTKVHNLLKSLGVPALSQVVTREAIYSGPKESNFKRSLVNWVLPFAQRYIYVLHPEMYRDLKNSICEDLRRLQINVVEQLFYRNTVKSSAIVSKERFECDCLLQDNNLYITDKSDSHPIYMELSKLFGGTPQLHLANFLHMITTMAESGSTEEQTENFLLNSQKLPKLPSEETFWSLPSLSSSHENVEVIHASRLKRNDDNVKTLRLKNKNEIVSNWPPADWKTAPGFQFARENGYRTQAASQPSQSSVGLLGDDPENAYSDAYPLCSSEVGTLDESIAKCNFTLLDIETVKLQPDLALHRAYLNTSVPHDGVNSYEACEGVDVTSSKFSMRTQLHTGNPDNEQALQTGRLGEHIAYKYYSEEPKNAVIWVNERTETGLPYDIVIGEEENCREYIEVKATKSARKDWFHISSREWQYAMEKGDSYSIAHVVLRGDDSATISTFRNPARLCQLGKLQLVVMMPKQQQ